MDRDYDNSDETEMMLRNGAVKVQITAPQKHKNGFTEKEGYVIPKDFMLPERLPLKIEEDVESVCRPEVSGCRSIYAQLLVAGAVFLLTTGSGMPVGYSAVLLPQLQGPNSTLPTTREMGSWIASVHSVSTPIGSFLSGIVADRWGRKNAMRVAILPVTVGWICIALAQSHWLILLGRIIIGVSVGLSGVPSQVMLGEISIPSIRGILMGSICISFSLGILIIYGLGSVEWHIAAGISTILPLTSLIALTFLPESPVWLARNNRPELAKKALYWLRGGPTKSAKMELKMLMDRVDQEKRQAAASTDGAWKLFTQPCILKPFLIVNAYGLLQVIAGTFLMIFYAVDLIARADEGGIDSYLFAMVTAAIRFIFSIIASGLLFFMGRRPLAIGSGFLSSFAAITLGVIIYLKQSEEGYFEPLTATVLIVTLLCIFMATNTCGSFVLPGVAIGELLPGKARGVLGGWIFTFFSVGVFASAKAYPFLLSTIGAHGLFWVFGAGSLTSTIFCILYLPESKGRTLLEIEDYFKESNVMWLTRDKKKYP